MTQMWPCSASKPLYHGDCFSDRNNAECAGAPGEELFLFSTRLNVREYEPRVVRRQHMEPEMKSVQYEAELRAEDILILRPLFESLNQTIPEARTLPHEC